MVIYLDIFVLENLIVNFFLLYITAQTLRKNYKIHYILLGAVMGVIYGLIAVYMDVRYLFNIPLKLAFSAIIILVSFKELNLIFILKATIVFVLYSILLAGFCIFIEINSSFNLELVFKTVSYKVMLSSMMILYVVLHRTITYLRDRSELANLIYDVEIILDDKSAKIKAFLDTGNELREPATNLPVMIIEKDAIPLEYLKCNYKYIIPFKVINGINSTMEGFKPKCIKIYKENKSFERQVIIAFCEKSLSGLNDYNALLSRGIL